MKKAGTCWNYLACPLLRIKGGGWLRNRKSQSGSVRPNTRCNSKIDVTCVADLVPISVSLGFAEFVFVNWLLLARFLELKNQAGNYNYIKEVGDDYL